MSTNINSKELLKEFIFNSFMPSITKNDCPTKINLRTMLKDYLFGQEMSLIKSEDLASRLMPDLIRRILERLDLWANLGVPFPCFQSDEKEELFVTWRHQKYEELTGYPAISENFISILEWVQSLSAREFLLPCAIYLKMLGAKKIFITDGPRDGGIDLIAKIEKSPFNSVSFFVQAKTGSRITRDAVLMEYGKYLSLPHEDIYQRYRRALEVDRSGDGASFCYAIFANCEFQNGAKEISSKLGVLLRSKIQIAYFLSQRFDGEVLKKAKDGSELNLKADLSLNISEKLPML